MKDPALSVTSLAYSDDLGLCGPFTYTLTLQGGGAYDATLFTFDNTIPQIDIYSTNNAHINTYTLELTGTLGTWGSATTLISVTVLPSCWDSLLTPDPVSNQIYTLSNPTLTFFFVDWTSSFAGCGTFTYTITDIYNQALDSSVITYTSATKTFSVFTSLNSKIGVT